MNAVIGNLSWEGGGGTTIYEATNLCYIGRFQNYVT